MITHLKIKNFAIIDDLSIDIKPGLNVITGETGVGKSIILGAISLISGEKTEIKTKIHKDKKSVIEAHFWVKDNPNIKSILIDNDLDYEHNSIIRREILPHGKSRSFVNDVPVNLTILKKLNKHLIDIHSQNQTIELNNDEFQMHVIDTISDNKRKLGVYRSLMGDIKLCIAKIKEYENKKNNIEKEQQYKQFIIKEIEQAELKIDEQNLLENKLNILNNHQNLKETLHNCLQILNDDNIGIINSLENIKRDLNKTPQGLEKVDNIHNRIENIYFETRDIADNMSKLQSETELSQNDIEKIENRLNIIYDLHSKHKTKTIEELIKICENLKKNVKENENLESIIKKEKDRLKELNIRLEKIANTISIKRQENSPKTSKKIQEFIRKIGMPEAKIQIKISSIQEYSQNGKDKIDFLLSANKNNPLMPIKNTASGGEKSRIMLAIRYIISKYYQLPCVIFDEIDTGISGKIANKMGEIIEKMNISQIIIITHLPQIASKGKHHYKVAKTTISNSTQTTIKLLNKQERIEEIAKIISGEQISNHALKQAQELLNEK